MSIPFPARSVALGALAILFAGTPVDPADAEPLRAAREAHAVLRLAGHDNLDLARSVRRYTGVVTALGSPDADGRIYSFQAAPVGPDSVRPQANALRGWRLTVLAGNRFSSVFEVRSNTEGEFTVAAEDGPLNGLAVSDVFVVEEIAIDRSLPDAPSPASQKS